MSARAHTHVLRAVAAHGPLRADRRLSLCRSWPPPAASRVRLAGGAAFVVRSCSRLCFSSREARGACPPPAWMRMAQAPRGDGWTLLRNGGRTVPARRPFHFIVFFVSL